MMTSMYGGSNDDYYASTHDQKSTDAMWSAPNETALLALMERTGYHMLQENGQRKYGPPPDWNGAPPPRGSEIFVGKIPRDCYEDELVPAFERCGRIYEFRLMMDFSGSNRGYCFVTYTCRDDARRAVSEMDNYEIRRGRFLGVCMSVDNCRLFVGGIPKNKQQDEIMEEMKAVTDGVVDVIVYPSANDKAKNRGFAFVEYASHRAAAMARRKLIPGRIQLWGHQIAVDWAEPEKEVDEDTMSRVKILYVRNLMPDTPENILLNIFNMAAGKERAVERVKKIRDFAFIHFYERDDAVRALSVMNRKEIDGVTVEVTFAKPVDKNNYTRYTRSNAKFPSQSCAIASALEQLQCLGLGKLEDLTNGSNPTSNGQAIMTPRVPLLGRCFSPNPPVSDTLNNNCGNFMKKPGEPERVYDFLPGMELTPAYANQIQRQFFKAPVQILEELCVKRGWESPKYQLHRTLGNDGSGDIQLFVFKVMVPHLRVVFTPNKLSASIDKAQNLAAEHALQELGVQIEGGDASVASAALMMMCRGGNVVAGTSGHDALSLLRAGLPLSLHSMSTPTETASLTDVQSAAPAYIGSTPAAASGPPGSNFFPLSGGRMTMSSQSGTLSASASVPSFSQMPTNNFHF